MNDYITALLMITIAEMGDKTQLLALAFASKFKARSVLLGIGIGAFLNHGIAILIGSYIGKLIPINTIQIYASILFLVFGFWSLIIDYNEDDESENIKSKYGPVLTVASAFFIGELGDKTQLTAMALGAKSSHPLLILLGTVSGMLLTGGLGILVGKLLGKKIPELTMKIIAAGVFIFFGTVGLSTRLNPSLLTPINITLYFGIILVIILLIKRYNAKNKDKAYQNKLASVLNDCKNCDKGHKKECSINIKRENLEQEYFGKKVSFSGDVSKYIDTLKYNYRDFGNKIYDINKSNKKSH